MTPLLRRLHPWLLVAIAAVAVAWVWAFTPGPQLADEPFYLNVETVDVDGVEPAPLRLALLTTDGDAVRILRQRAVVGAAAFVGTSVDLRVGRSGTPTASHLPGLAPRLGVRIASAGVLLAGTADGAWAKLTVAPPRWLVAVRDRGGDPDVDWTSEKWGRASRRAAEASGMTDEADALRAWVGPAPYKPASGLAALTLAAVAVLLSLTSLLLPWRRAALWLIGPALAADIGLVVTDVLRYGDDLAPDGVGLLAAALLCARLVGQAAGAVAWAPAICFGLACAGSWTVEPHVSAGPLTAAGIVLLLPVVRALTAPPGEREPSDPRRAARLSVIPLGVAILGSLVVLLLALTPRLGRRSFFADPGLDTLLANADQLTLVVLLAFLVIALLHQMTGLRRAWPLVMVGVLYPLTLVLGGSDFAGYQWRPGMRAIAALTVIWIAAAFWDACARASRSRPA